MNCDECKGGQCQEIDDSFTSWLVKLESYDECDDNLIYRPGDVVEAVYTELAPELREGGLYVVANEVSSNSFVELTGSSCLFSQDRFNLVSRNDQSSQLYPGDKVRVVHGDSWKLKTGDDHIVVNHGEYVEVEALPGDGWNRNRFVVIKRANKVNPINKATQIEDDKGMESADKVDECLRDLKTQNKPKPHVGQMMEDFHLALLAVAENTRYGNEKYGEPGTWKLSKNLQKVYADASGRHGLIKYATPYDNESGLHHQIAKCWNELAILQDLLAKGTPPRDLSEVTKKHPNVVYDNCQWWHDAYAAIKGEQND